MLNRRKHIISAFAIFTIVFIGFYFVTGTRSRNKGSYCGTSDPHTYRDTTKRYSEGKTLFRQQCASCHILFKDFVGPDLIGFTTRGPWNSKEKVLDYLNDPNKFYNNNKNKYVIDLYSSSQVAHLVFSWKEKEIDDFIYYLDSEEKFRKKENP